LIGFKENEAIDESVFKKKIIEQENKWSIKPSDEDLGFSLDSQLSILNQTLLQDELGDEKEYDNLEDYYARKKTQKSTRSGAMNVTTNLNWWHRIWELPIQKNAQWGLKTITHGLQKRCPNCDALLSVEHTVYEYPLFMENAEETVCDGCDLLTDKKTAEKTPSTTLRDFM
jgi:hypothetical protein